MIEVFYGAKFAPSSPDRCLMTKISLEVIDRLLLKGVMRFFMWSLVIFFTGLPALSYADSQTELRGEVFCFPAKSVPKLMDRLAKVKSSKRDVVDVSLKPKFLIKDGGDWPEQFYLAKDGEVVMDLPFSTQTGEVPDFIAAVRANSDADICVKDKSRAARPKHDEGLYFEMGLSPLFHNRSGVHPIDELSEGTKDGKSFYKKMIPVAIRPLMPDTKYLAVRYDDFAKTADILARIGEAEIPLKPQLYKDMHVISFKALKDMGAGALIIRGGPYQLQPTVSIKTMNRFGWGQDDNEENEK